MAGQLDVPAAVFAEYARRPQTMTDHARQLAAILGLRTPTMADLPSVIEAAAEAARGDRPRPAYRRGGHRGPADCRHHPARRGCDRAHRHRRPGACRKRAADALVAGLSAEHLTKLDGLLVVDPSVGMTPFAWLKAMPIAPKADHIRELLDRLRSWSGASACRSRILPAFHEGRLQQFVREGHASDAHQLGRYAEHRRRAILVATVLDLETRLTDAILDMADKLIGGLFAKARNAARRRYAASASDVGRLMRMFHGTIEALAAAQEGDADAFEAVDDAVGWPKLLRVREEVQELASLAGEDPLVRAADRWKNPAKVRTRSDRGAAVPVRTRRRPHAGGAQIAGGPQPVRQARGAGGRAHAVPQGMAAPGDGGGRAEPAPIRDGGSRDAARQAALGRCLGRTLGQLPPLRQLPAAAGRRSRPS